MTVKIGIIGCGGIAHPHANGYLKIPDQAKVVAVCDVVAENAQKRSEQVGGAQIFSDYNEMLATADIDAVDICLPHHLHKDAIVAAANAKKHILCEKPLCLTVEESEAVQKAVQENGVTLMCAHNQLTMPAVLKAKELINEGTLGKVYEIRTTDSFYHSFNPKDIGWRGNRKYIGGGELIDTGYHPTYLLLYLASAEPSEVVAMVSKHRLEFMDGEDSAQVLVRFADGSVGNIVTSWAYQPTSNTEKFSIVAEKGSVHGLGNKLYYRPVKGEEQVFEYEGVDTFAAEIADFVTCVRENRRPVNTEVEGTHVLKVILAAYKSSEEKRIVSLSDLV